MGRVRMERRGFLKAAAQAVVAAPSVYGATKKTATNVAPPALPKVKLNVRDNGATGDGKTKDTLAIQLTIERCSALGGGEVVVPAGDYLTGALAMRSNVTLRIEEGATLNGSPDMADYPFAQV